MVLSSQNHGLFMVYDRTKLEIKLLQLAKRQGIYKGSGISISLKTLPLYGRLRKYFIHRFFQNSS